VACGPSTESGPIFCFVHPCNQDHCSGLGISFAPGTRGFSRNAEDWAKFGEYLGGTLGGIYGLLAFIGVLITIFEQRRQSDLLRTQINRDELQRQSWWALRVRFEKTYQAGISATPRSHTANQIGFATRPTFSWDFLRCLRSVFTARDCTHLEAQRNAADHTA